MEITGSSSAKSPATNSTPSLCVNLSNRWSTKSSRTALFQFSPPPPPAVQSWTSKTFFSASVSTTSVELLSGTTRITSCPLCPKPNSQWLSTTPCKSAATGSDCRTQWKLKRALGIGSERRLRAVVSEVREFAKTIVREKKRDLSEAKRLESVDLLSRFLNSGHTDEKFVADIVISFILAGRDTTSAALTWFFWLLSQNPRVENEILREINEAASSESAAGGGYDEVKEMVYTHAALCESMRLYPPVPTDSKQVANDDVLPDGTKVKKGMTVTYHVYAMGRMEEIWGPDWAEYRPERWLEREERGAHKWKFVGRDTYSYPVFQAGPRICLRKEMAFLQMKRVVSAVLKRFKVEPREREGGAQPELLPYLTAKMKGGLPVTVLERA